MFKLASITLTVVVVSWLRIALTPALQDTQTINLVGGFTMLWVAVFGAYFGWLLLLIMVRQLGAAVRGK